MVEKISMHPQSAHPESAAAAPVAGTRRLSAFALWTVIAGLTLGSVATLIARFFQGGKPAADLTVTSVIVFISVCAMGTASWWLLITRRRRVSEGRGARAGALTALLGYVLVFQVSHLVYGLASPGFYGHTLLERIGGGLILSLLTLIFQRRRSALRGRATARRCAATPSLPNWPSTTT